MNIEKLAKIKNFCYSVAKMPTDFIEAMTPYELLNWFCDYLKNTLVPKYNESIETYNGLKEFVNDYFNNLDVQDEINIKIDDLVSDGTMDQLLNTNLTGSLQDLDTEDKSNLVNAINEVNENAKTSFDNRIIVKEFNVLASDYNDVNDKAGKSIDLSGTDINPDDYMIISTTFNTSVAIPEIEGLTMDYNTYLDDSFSFESWIVNNLGDMILYFSVKNPNHPAGTGKVVLLKIN